MTAIAASALYRRYGRRYALLNVSFELPEGTLAILTGRNGSGKSTLLRVVGTALRPDRGGVRVLGHDVATEPEPVRRSTALLGHRTFLYEPLSAFENLALAARLIGGEASRPAVLERLREVGLAERADDPVSTFSAGMRQRLALARVLLKEAPVVLLDEPYGHLDPPGFRLVDGILEALRAKGRTVLMATHLIERGQALCGQALLLEGGRLSYQGPARDLPQPDARSGFAEGAS